MLPIDLKDKVAIVSGSSQGVGFGVALMLAKAGCCIAGCGRSDISNAKVKKSIAEIEREGQHVFYKKVDVKSELEINAFVDDVLREFGHIDILVSNAGVNFFTAPDTCDSDFWDENANLNLKSHWVISKVCYPQLKKNRGTIIVMSSNHAYSTLPNCFPYNVTKAGLIGLVKTLAIDWSPEIRVIGLAPGFIQTQGGEDWFASFENPEAKRKEVIDIHPVKKLGTVNEVGALCAFLCSDYAGFITGTTYLIDGGRSAVMQDN